MMTPEEMRALIEETMGTKVSAAVVAHLEHERPTWEAREYGTPEAIDALMAAVAKARPNFGPIKKNKQGRTGNVPFMYAPLENLLEATLVPLAEQGITVWQPLSGPNPDGKHRVTTWVRGHGAKLESIVEFEGSGSIKDFGAQCTYYRRYSMIAMFMLDADADLDEGDLDIPKQNQTRREPPPMPEGNGRRQQPRQEPQRQQERPAQQERRPEPPKTQERPQQAQQAPRQAPAPERPKSSPPPPRERAETAEARTRPLPFDEGDRPTSEIPEPADDFEELFGELAGKLDALNWPSTRITAWVDDITGKAINEVNDAADVRQLIASADAHLLQMQGNK